MYEHARDVFAAHPRGDPRRRDLEGGADHPVPAGRRDRGGRPPGPQLLRQQLPRALRPPAAARRGARRPRRPRLRPLLGALHLRHPGPAPGAGAAPRRLLRLRGRHPLLLLLRRQRRRLRGAARRAGRHRLRRAQPRLDHRRHPARQGAALPLRPRRPGRPGSEARRGGRRPAPAGGHRRRLLDGRRPGPARRDLRHRRAAPGAGAGGRLATPPGFVGRTGRGTPEHFGVQGRVDIITSTLGKALGGAAGGFVAGRREVVDLLPPAGPPLPLLQHARARPSWARAWPRSTCSRARPSCATGSWRTPGASGRA